MYHPTPRTLTYYSKTRHNGFPTTKYVTVCCLWIWYITVIDAYVSIAPINCHYHNFGARGIRTNSFICSMKVNGNQNEKDPYKTDVGSIVVNQSNNQEDEITTSQLIASTTINGITDNNNTKQNNKNGITTAEATTSSVSTITVDMSNRNTSTRRLQYTAYNMICAGIVGIVTGTIVAYFKLSIETVRVTTYSFSILDYLHNEIGAILIPVMGSLIVGSLIVSGPFSPGLRGKVSQIEALSDDTTTTITNNKNLISTLIQEQLPLLRKSAAAICTLGTGCSLGPEGPCVELGIGISRSCMGLFDKRPNSVSVRLENYQQESDTQDTEDDKLSSRLTWNRILLSCGAAAGVSAGFDAPVAGVFFVLEVIQAAINDVTIERRRQAQLNGSSSAVESEQASIKSNNLVNPAGLFSSSATLSPVLLSSVLSALCARSILGDHLTFNVATTNSALASAPFINLPLYLLLGSICGIVAFLFSQSAKFSRSFFIGEIGNDAIRNIMKSIPQSQKPIVGGLFCGITALYFPQILFFGYETLNSLLSNTVSVPTNVLLSLLFVKGIATAVCIGSGLVGGTLAPALFLGGVTGASFHNIVVELYQITTLHINHIINLININTDTTTSIIMGNDMLVLPSLPSYAMVGSASVLAALFRAPLTATLLLFELSRDYDIILPIIASAGVGSVVADLLEDAAMTVVVVPGTNPVRAIVELPKNDVPANKSTRNVMRRDKDPVSWGDLSDKEEFDESSIMHDQHKKITS